MIGFERSDDYQPLFWVAGRPIHVTTLLVALHTFSLVAVCLLQGFGLPGLPFALMFSPAAVLHGEVWRVVSYVFVHDVSIWTIFNLFVLFFLGREVERFFGRTMFTWLYAGLTLIGSLTLLGLHFAAGADAGDAQWINGGNLVLFGVFIAFVVVYPNMQFYFFIPSVWIAYAMLAIGTLTCFAGHQWHGMTLLWATTAFAFFYTRYARMGGEAFGPLANWRAYLPRRPVRRELPARPRLRQAVDQPAHASRVAANAGTASSGGERWDNVHESIDPLLDKISKHGLASLTHSERAALERARVSLLRKDRSS